MAAEFTLTTFAEFLQRRPERYNTMFALLRRSKPKLDGERFGAFLVRVLQPLVDALPEESRERATDELYEISLGLVAGDFLAGGHPLVDRCWNQLLPGLSPLVGREPGRVAVSMTNACYHVGQTPGTRPDAFLSRLRAAGAEASTVDELLLVTQAAAWLSGLSHFREGVLARAGGLSSFQRELLVGSPEEWDVWKDDPWYEKGLEPKLRLVRQVGDFAGFGGLFIRPPMVEYAGDESFWVEDGESLWLLVTDRFGATFHRHFEKESRPPARDDVSVEKSHVCLGRERVEVGEISSWASGRKTVVCALRHSHRLRVLACP